MLSDRIRTNEIFNIGQTAESKNFIEAAKKFGVEQEKDNSIELFKVLTEIMNRIEVIENELFIRGKRKQA